MNLLNNLYQLILEDPLFFVISLTILLAGILAVSLNNLIRAGFALIISFLGVSLLYFKLDVLLLAIAQVMIYAVGISLVIIFSIMLLSQAKEVDLPKELQVTKAQAQMITIGSFLASLFLTGIVIFFFLSKKVADFSNLSSVILLAVVSLILATIASLFLFFVILNIRENGFNQDSPSNRKLVINKSFFLKDSLKNLLAFLATLGFYLVMSFHVFNLDRENKLAIFSDYLSSQQQTELNQFTKIGEIFVSSQIVSFEAISVLLLVALIIAISISKKDV